MNTAQTADTKAASVLALHHDGLWPIPNWWPLSGGRCACRKPDCTSPGKHPCLPSWKPYQTTAPTTQEVKAWLEKYPQANWGIVLGEAAGVLAVDFDGVGAEALLLEAGVELPACAAWRSPGGAKILLKHPGGRLQKKICLLQGEGCAVDLLADGSQVVVPPSRHYTGGVYAWAVPLTEGIADAPAALLTLARQTSADNGNGHPITTPPTGARIPKGARNSTLTSMAGAMRRRGMSEAAILAALREENSRCETPLSETEVRDIARSVGRYAPADERAGGDRPQGDTLRVCSVVDVLRLTQSDSERVRTGLPGLDTILGGGIPARRLILVGGTTAAGKTALALQIAEAFSKTGGVVVVLPYDEGAEPAAVRVGQQHGFMREQVEDRLESLLVKLDGELADKALRFPDPTMPADPTIEDGAEAVAALMRERPGAPGLLVIDSMQRAHTRTSDATRSERERVTDNTQTARRLSVVHDIAVLATSETNRAFYRSKRDEDRVTDAAAFAECRAEFWADVALTMRARDDDSDLVDVRVAKNRLGAKTPMVLKLDRGRSRFAEVDAGLASMRDATLARKVDEATAVVLRALDEHTALSRAQLWDVVQGSREAFNESLRDLKAAGVVVTEPRGRSMLYRRAEIPA